jgi:hypothetical protein
MPVTVLPTTEQIVGVLLTLKVTPRPDVAVALAVAVPPTAMVLGEKLIVPMVWAKATPVPLKLTLCGLPVALLVIVIAPVRVPATVGVKVTLIVQLAPAASVDPQVVVRA